MSLPSGTRIGVYEVLGPLGAGGMGEVYRARDARLNREVALKVLPENLSADADRLARFAREAQVLASLNHPNIAAIYGLEESGDVTALVLEMVEGPTLAERIAGGPLPTDEALDIARQIAEALEAAHEQAIVHRDLKPANVKVRADGTVKVLDFGLAKALDPSAGQTIDASLSPTLTARATQAGIILGTAAYMSPEQAKGKAVDKRADIWAFGVVLHEMLVGKRVFTGETASEVLAAVILKDPDLTRLPAATPPVVRRLLARCLEKDPKRRLRDVGEARIALSEPVAEATETAGATSRPGAAARPRWLAWIAAGLFVALMAALAMLARASRTLERSVARYDIQMPYKTELNLSSRPNVSISPDGSTIVFAATSEGISHLYLRKREEGEARMLPNTEGASNPVFSPDGRQIAFFGGNKLKKVTPDGNATILGDVNDPRGITWLDDASIVYVPEAISPLWLVPAGGGALKPITKIDADKEERSHRWPEALPGGKTVLFTIGLVSSPDSYDASEIAAVEVDTGERRTVLQGASMVRYVEPGHLVFARSGSLYAQPFDAKSLAVHGIPSLVVQGISGDSPTGAAHFAVARDGTLAYVPGSRLGGQRRLVWADDRGQFQPIDLAPAVFNDLRISPDGTRAAVIVGSSGSGDVWIYHFERKTFTRLTFNGTNASPVWFRDGASLVYASIDASGRTSKLFRVPADGSRDPEEIVALRTRVYLGGVSADGLWAILGFANLAKAGKTDVMRLELKADARPAPIASTDFDEYSPALSPDGRWVAYQSDEGGRDEIYVRDASGSGGRWQISTDGGEEPSWSADGREMYYRSESRLMRVPVETKGTFQARAPQLLFDGVYRMRSDTGISYDMDPKSSRFLMIRPADEGDLLASLRIVLNWSEELRRLVPAKP